MPVWTVHAPPSPGLSAEPADDVILIREGFSWSALLFGPIWTLAHRMWLTSAVLIAVMIAMSLIHAKLGQAATWPLAIGFLFWFGCEARDLRRATLAYHDWQLVGVVDARNAKLAERRYLEKLADERAANSHDYAAAPVTIAPQWQAGTPPVIGYIESGRT